MIHFIKSLLSYIETKGLNSELESILSRIFDESYYLEQNPDVAKDKASPFKHYLNKGFIQRRLPCSESAIASAVIAASENPEYAASVVNYQGLVNAEKENSFSSKKLILPYHSEGNFFFREIAQHILEAASESGIDARLVDEKQFAELENSHNIHCFFVAPQEFFFLGSKLGLHKHAKKFMPEVTYLLAEQPQTVFFLSQLKYIADEAHIVDMNFHVATYLRALGVECHYLPLGYMDFLRPNEIRKFGQSAENMYLPSEVNGTDFANIEQRPIDAVFIGNGCERRQKFFGKYAEQLCRFNMSVFMPDWQVPHSSGGLATLDANDSLALCQRSKIFLNIHRDDFDYFEWHRICMRGFLSGAMVLTEPVFKVPEFEAGVHYLECSAEEIPEKIDWLLHSDEGKQQLVQVAAAGRVAYLKTSMKDSVSAYLSFIGSSAKVRS